VSNGFFIAFEGGEGAGKSTHAKRLAEYLTSLGHDVIVTREPGGTGTAEKIRNVLLDPEVTDLPNQAEALLFAAARADHAWNKIRPALERGAIVICDRYIDSSAAYQGGGRGLGVDFVRQISEWATGTLLPDFTIYMEVPLEDAGNRMEGEDRMEIQSREFHRLVHETFIEIAATNPRPHAVIDATQSKDEVAAEIRRIIDTALSAR